MFVIVSALIGFGVYGYQWGKAVAVIISGVVAYIFAGYAKPDKVSRALAYGVLWVLVGLILDLLITAKFDPTIFSSKAFWASYLLVLIAPFLRIKKTFAGGGISQ